MQNLRDYITLTKPRLNTLALFTTLAGFYLGAPSPFPWVAALLAMAGTTLVAGGCGTLNQWFEVEEDKKMRRTRKRPLVMGRLKGDRAFWYGVGLSVGGVLVLYLWVNVLTAFLGACALFSYLVLYTPLKKYSSLCTVVGAIPGAIPPMMGWAAVRDTVGPEGLCLFAILFFWQMPHFLAIGWLYREDYERAGFPMLSVVDPQGGVTGLMAVAYAFALWPVSLLPTYLHMTGSLYFWAALLMGLGFILYSALLAWKKSLYYARGLFWLSITYLPVLFALMCVNKV
ncbi:MAG TPA: heme o synthase [bacterium]|nr:heme o synthase [bacterium]